MALEDRVLLIDDESGSPLDVSELVVGGLGDLSGVDLPAQDLTGAMHESPKRKPTGFVAPKSFTLQLEKTAATLAAFYGAGSTANMPRTVGLDRGGGDEWECEYILTSTKILTEPGENGIDIIETSWESDGDPAYALS